MSVDRFGSTWPGRRGSRIQRVCCRAYDRSLFRFGWRSCSGDIGRCRYWPPGRIVRQPNGAELPAVRLSRVGPSPTRLLSIARLHRRRPISGPGAASSRGPIDAPGGGRPTGRTPRYSGRAASASSRRSTRSRATSVAAGGGRVAARAVQSPGDPDKAACRARGSDPAAGIPAAARAEPRRYATSRLYRRGRRSVRWRATVSVDSWRVLFCNTGCLTLTCQFRGRVTAGVKAVTTCHDGGRRPRCLFAASRALPALVQANGNRSSGVLLRLLLFTNWALHF